MPDNDPFLNCTHDISSRRPVVQCVVISDKSLLSSGASPQASSSEQKALVSAGLYRLFRLAGVMRKSICLKV
jgi:hypothetical protein